MVLSPTATVQLTPPEKHRFLLLDALRGLAAIIVVIFHSAPYMQWKIFQGSNGSLAVDFFFCLSGFVIAFSYEKRLRENLRFKDFTAARFIRLYPTYFIGTFVGLIITAFADSARHSSLFSSHGSLALFALATFMLPVMRTAMAPVLYPLDGPAWSLFFEIIANLSYAFAVRWKFASTLFLIAISLLCAALLSMALFGSHSVDCNLWCIGPMNEPAKFYPGFARVGLSFTLGVLVERLYRRFSFIELSSSTRYLMALFVSVALLTVLMAKSQMMQSRLANIAYIALIFPLITLLGAFARVPHGLTKSCIALGEISYPLYLLHGPLLYLFDLRHVSALLENKPAILPWLLPLAMLSLCALSYWVATCIDLPVRRYLSRLYNPQTGASARRAPESA